MSSMRRVESMKADVIITSRAVFDSINPEPYPGYVAVKGQRILEVGKGEPPEELIGRKTRRRDYGQNLLMAGFHDSHTHLLMAGMYRTYVNLADARSEEEAAAMVRVWAAANPGGEWIIGFGWYHVFWESLRLPEKEALDRFFPHRPVCLINAEAHGAWVNSEALRRAGIDKNTPDPPGGKIQRREDGEATGFLYETAVGLVGAHAFRLEEEEEKKILRSFLAGAAEKGITSVNDVQPYFHGNMGNLAVYSEMDKSGELTVRIHAAPDLLGDLDQVAAWRDRYTSDKLKVDMLKQFLDGVCTTHTALVLEDYADAPGNRGTSLSDAQAIRKAVPEAHRRGFSVKLHSCGDKSARMALDYYEEAIRALGKNQCRHAIEHIEMLDARDLPRFGELGIVPSVQPEHIALTQTFAENPYRVVLGEERAGRTWPFKDLYDTAGFLAIGSDCPVVDNDPFLEIYRGVTRLHNDGQPEGGWNPGQKLTLYEVLRSYTYGSAYGVRREAELGSLEAGKFADIIVLDRDLFSVAEAELREASVILTVMDGQIIYEKSAV